MNISEILLIYDSAEIDRKIWIYWTIDKTNPQIV